MMDSDYSTNDSCRNRIMSEALASFLDDVLRDLDCPLDMDVDIVLDNARIPPVTETSKSPRKRSVQKQICRWEGAACSEFIARQVTCTPVSPNSRWDRMTNKDSSLCNTSVPSLPERKEEFDRFTLANSPNFMRRSKRNLFMRSNSVPKGLQALPY